MLSTIMPFLGILSFLGLAWCFSENRKSIKLRPVISGMLLLFFTAFFFLRTSTGEGFKKYSGEGVEILQKCANDGAYMVVHPKMLDGSSDGLMCTGVVVVASIVFMGSLSAVLYHLGILQLVIKIFAFLVTRILGVSGAEALTATANMFVGMVEAPLMVKPYLKTFTHSEMFCMMTSGMASIAGGVLIIYSGFISKSGTPAGHLVIASVLSVFASVVVAKIMVPETDIIHSQNEMQESQSSQDVNIIDAACRGASDGMMLGLNVVGMLIAFCALIGMVNMIFILFPQVNGESLTLQRIFGWVFCPLAWLMGIPSSECPYAGELLGIKTVLNEFLAYMDMTQPENLALLSPRSRVIMSYALCGFANFGSLAIMVGGLGAMVPERRREIAELAMRSLVSGSIAAFLTAALAAIFI